MINYFPTSNKDETLYSIIARYHIHSGNRSITTTLLELFNTKKITATTDLPCNLSQLSSNLKISIPDSMPNNLIKNHTIFPFYKPFWSDKKAEQIIKLMKERSVGKVHLKAGIYANSIRQWEYLRYCPECIKEDKANSGEAYWHRVHQIPGVLICPIHNKPTYNSRIRTYEINQLYYYAASMENCNANNVSEPKYNDCLIKKLYLLSADIKWVLDNGTDLKIQIEYADAYTDKLKQMGLVSKKGQVDQNTFVNLFVKYHGEEFLEQLGLSVNQEDKHNWVSMMVRKHKQEPHPLKHLLMIRFLYGSARDFFTSNTKYEPFLKGPYPCLNAAADHYKLRIINEIDIIYSRSKKPYAIFCCTCGFKYIRYGPDMKDTDLYRYDNVLSYGEMWIQRFIELIEKDQLHLREVSRILKIDLKTVRKLVVKLKLKSIWMNDVAAIEVNDKFQQSQNIIKTIDEKLINYNRNKWEMLKKENRSLSKTQLRKIDIRTYNWLYYHDKSWLENNSLETVKHKNSNSRVDWRKRDEELLAKVEDIIRKILNLDTPVRINIERVGKELGKLYLLRNHLGKLPLTKTFLNSVCEDKQRFLIRKAKMAINLLDNYGENLKYWRVKQLIGVSGVLPIEVEEEINNLISYRLNNNLD